MAPDGRGGEWAGEGGTFFFLKIIVPKLKTGKTLKVHFFFLMLL